MPTSQKFRKQQKRDAKDFGGIETPRSGGFWSFAGDVKTDRFLIEDKTTDKKGYRLTKSTWHKIEQEALMEDKIPLMSIEIQDINLVVLDKNDFISLIER